VIGAGAFGCSAAYHLARAGLKQVVLLDRYAPGSQTSPRAAGLFKLVQVDESMTRLAQLSIAIVTGFEAATGVSLPHVRSGSLLVARTASHAEMIKAEAVASVAWGVELAPVTGGEVRRLAPFLSPRGVRVAYHVPGDIYVEEPRALIDAYLEAGRRRGLTVLDQTPATAIRVERGEVTAVETPRGTIRTPLAVDAAGVWAPGVGELAGARVPIQPMRHQLAITPPLPGFRPEEPIVRIVDAAAYVRPCRGGLMWGGFEANPLPLAPPDLADPFTIDQTPLDRPILDRFAAELAPNVPALRDAIGAELAEHRGGLFTMTADGRLLIGPHPTIRGFWTATGCNGSGFSLSSGVGHVLAEWIAGGAPPFDVTPLTPARFSARALPAEELRDAAVWQYANYYTPHATGPRESPR
jgi:4-methylaminobutanoate oxidase (formaldehyde-forming)